MARVPLAFLLLLACRVRAEYDEITFPSCSATAGQYLDVSSLLCTTCPVTTTPDEAQTSCRCQAGTVLSGGATTSGACISCTNGTAPTRDGLSCLACSQNSSATGTTLSGTSCTCTQPGLVIVERDENGALLDAFECRACPAGQRPNNGECISCPAAHMLATSTFSDCDCEAGYTLFSHTSGFWGSEKSCNPTPEQNELVVTRNLLPSTYAQKTFDELQPSQGGSLEVATSKAVEQLLLPSATECLRAINRDTVPTTPRAQPLLEGNQACQAVGNLCVLYDYVTSTAACSIFNYLKSASTALTPNNPEWTLHLPGLYYQDRGASALSRAAPRVPVTLALPHKSGSRLRYLLGTYSLNGTYLGLRELTDQLQLCPGGAPDPSAFLDVGTDMQVRCDVPLTTLLRQLDDVLFYDLYLYYDTSSTNSLTDVDAITSGTLYPVPVRVLNVKVGAQAVHRNSEDVDDQLTRRFYVVDAVSGVDAYPNLPAAVRYLRSARLTVTVKSDDETPSQMLPPVLEVEYADIAIPSTATSTLEAEEELERSGISPSSVFRMTYTMEFGNSDQTINQLFVIAIVAWLLGSLVAGGLIVRRNQASQFDGYPRLVLQICGVFATTFFILLYAITTWWLLLYKAQRRLHFLMPTPKGSDDNYYLGLMPFQVFVIVLFIAKTLHMVDLLLVQTRHDLFFIDWEQPRAIASAAHGDDHEAGGGGGDSGGGGGALPVSVWRTIFVANEWVKLQDARTISTEINLFCLLFLSEGMGLGRSARLIPHGTGDGSTPEHMLLRFALSSGLLLATSLVQFLWMWGFWQRYVKDRVWQFVDLLAVTNISCLLLEERHFGFYLHGRSVHDHADADMAQLNAHLKLEAESLVTTRGFTSDSMVQTYEVYLSRRVRDKYDTAFLGALYSEPGRRPGNRRAAGARGGKATNVKSKGFRAAPEEGVARQRELNRFLMAYLSTPTPTAAGAEGSAPADKPIVRAKLGLERYGAPPDMGYGERSIFLEETSGRFKRLLLAGREYDVVLFSVLTYALFDMATSNTYVAIFFTYAFDRALGALRSELATRNIAAKTLLDDRFLL